MPVDRVDLQLRKQARLFQKNGRQQASYSVSSNSAGDVLLLVTDFVPLKEDRRALPATTATDHLQFVELRHECRRRLAYQPSDD